VYPYPITAQNAYTDNPWRTHGARWEGGRPPVVFPNAYGAAIGSVGHGSPPTSMNLVSGTTPIRSRGASDPVRHVRPNRYTWTSKGARTGAAKCDKAPFSAWPVRGQPRRFPNRHLVTILRCPVGLVLWRGCPDHPRLGLGADRFPACAWALEVAESWWVAVPGGAIIAGPAGPTARHGTIQGFAGTPTH